MKKLQHSGRITRVAHSSLAYVTVDNGNWYSVPAGCMNDGFSKFDISDVDRTLYFTLMDGGLRIERASFNTSYCEAVKQEPFDWNAFLKQDAYTEEELFRAKTLAKSWVTCACGLQCSVIPRAWDGIPRDCWLIDLGLAFDRAVTDICKPNDNAVQQARIILAQIEARSIVIIEATK